jgi:4,5-dihydroxyphthalate decarboxylase
MPAGTDVTAMLLAGEIDAAILAEAPKDGPLRPLIPDPGAAAAAWKAKHGAIQINHMVVVREGVDPKPIYDLLVESRQAAGNPEMNPFGIEENRRNLEVAIDCLYRQNMLPRRPSVEELFE